MPAASYPLVCTPLPPIAFSQTAARRNRAPDLPTRLVRLAYALIALALPVVGVSIVELVRPNSGLIVPQLVAFTDSSAEISAPPRLGERRWDIAQIATLGSAFGRVRR